MRHMRIVKKIRMLYNFFCAHSVFFVWTMRARGALAGRTAGVPQCNLFFSLALLGFFIRLNAGPAESPLLAQMFGRDLPASRQS